MLKIAACFKVTDDFDELTKEDWQKALEPGQPETGFVRRILGCFDEAALENALLLKKEVEAAGRETSLLAITVNPGYSEHILKRIKATGFDSIICLHTKESTDFRPDITAGLLADQINKSGADVVFCGQQSAPGNTGSVPVMLADKLGYGLFSQVVKVTSENGGSYSLCEYKKGFLKTKLSEKSVCVMGNTEKSYLRIPTLKEKIAVKDFAPEDISSITEECKEDMRFSIISKERNTVMRSVSDETAADIINRLKSSKQQ